MSSLYDYEYWYMGSLFRICQLVPSTYSPQFNSSYSYCRTICFSVSAIGVLVSIVLPTQLKATEVLMVIATPSFMISGFTWPLDQMPTWVQAFSNSIPLTHFLKAFRILMVEAGDVKQTLPAIKAIALIAIIAWIAAYVALWIKIRKHKKAQRV